MSTSSICLSPNGGAVSAGDDPRLLVGTVRGVWHIDLAGGAEAVCLGLQDQHIGALLEVPGGSRLVAGTYGGGVLLSDDVGRSWRPPKRGGGHSTVFSLSAQVRRDGASVLYAGTEPVGLERSFDGGESWDEVNGLDAVAEATAWTFPTPPHHAHLKHVGFDPSDDDVLYVSIEQGDLLRSCDSGVTWEPVTSYESADDPYRRDIHRLLVDPGDPRLLYLNTGCGFYRSEDGGASWTHPLTPESIVGYPDPLFVDPDAPGTLYLAGAASSPRGWKRGVGGTAAPSVLRSTDGGAHWEEMADGLPRPIPGNIEAMSLHVRGDAVSLYLATTQGAVWEATPAAGPWRQITAAVPPVSKSYHYRHFLPSEERDRVMAFQVADGGTGPDRP